MTMSAIPLLDAQAQQATSTPNATEELPTVTVEGDNAPANALEATTGLSRMPGTIQDTPQTITVISQETMQQQGVTTLEQALRNVPGVTASSGEGNGGMNGDQFRIRGFQANGDIYVDGLRDFGSYTRDSFAFESVEVFKGSSSENFGMGTTGGAINITQKQAHLGDKYDFEGQIGNGPLYRVVGDVNKQIDDTTAVRFVGMYTEQDLVDRDYMYKDRYGFLGAVGFGLGTDQTLHLNIFYQDGDGQTDMGVPFATRSTGVSLPVTEYPGVSRSNYYGKETDKDNYDVTMFTAKYRNEVNDWLTVTNDSRLAYYNRYYTQSAATCAAATCGIPVINGNPNVPYSLGGPAGFDQETYGGQNITTAIADFSIGKFRNQFVAGVDFYFQNDARSYLTNSGTKTVGTIADPSFYNSDSFYVYDSGLNLRRSQATNSAIFASDRFWFVDTVSLLAGGRFDNYNINYETSTTGGRAPSPGVRGWSDYDSHSSFFSPSLSLIWEPTKEQTYYVSWGKSFTPPGGNVAVTPNPLSGTSAVAPESNETTEIGAKFSLLDGKLGLTGALFHTIKGNAYYYDAVGDAVATGDRQRVQGVELGLTGNLTDAWTVQAAYTYLDSEITYSPPATAATIGNEVNYAPRNSASIWTTYDVAKHWLTSIPGELLIGGGITYTDGYYTNTANTAWIPETFSLDALISYKQGNYRFAVNGYNLTDELNYVAGFNNRAVVGTGRAVVFTVGATF
ncbi:TonB-dependent siderophore receptor [Ancylobacter sonchi]|nr:TonB-dependent siderophore receptor [Ancylobacter sonchi]